MASESESAWFAEQFEQHRPRMRAVAYRILGSLSEAEDAVQEAWLRASGAGADGVENVGGWLTTIVARVSLNALRSRSTRREDPIGLHMPDPIVTRDDRLTPEDAALLADSIGLALLVVLDRLGPAERLAFVLHDLFDIPFEDIAPIVDRTPAAARQLASRARRRVRGAETAHPERDRARQRKVVDAFFAAARRGDLDGLLRVLDPDVVLRSDFGGTRPPAPPVIRGAPEVAASSILGAALPNSELYPALVNGTAGVVVTARGRPFVIMGFIVAAGRIVEIHAFADSARVGRLAASVLGGASPE